MSNPFKWDSIPLINYVCNCDSGVFDEFQKQLIEFHRSHSLRKVDWHKRRLGPSKTTWTGECRFHVWEGKDWRVFVNNGHGASFEVRVGLTIKRAFAAWNDYRKQMGLE